MQRLFRLCTPALLLLVSSTALAQQALIVADGGTSAIAFRPQVGKIVTFVCSSNLNPDRKIWGTDVYMDESPICTAAVHAGVLTAGTSGQVTIVMGAGAQLFEGMKRNGVTSLSYGPWGSTYSFTKGNEPGQIDWNTTFDRVPDDFSSPITVVCPPKGNLDSYVWGTDVYSAGSAICVAAVHAGVITLDAGGRVTVTPQPKQGRFMASVRNGVSTWSWTDPIWRAYPQPYMVTPDTIAVTPPTSAPAIGAGPRQAAPSGGTSGPRTIKLAGFTAVGTAVPIVPRTITLSGFSATGTATPIVPRTIPLPGWSGVGAPITP